ncbi:MAG: nuclear transport factor 2 family protein [Ferruginibacter sp.]
MKKYLLLFCFFAIAINSCTHQQTPLTKEEVLDVIEKFDDGWKHKNMKQVDSTLAKDYTYFTQSGNIFSRDSVVATAGESDYSLRDMSRTELDITLFDNTAIVSTRWKGKGNYRGVLFDEDQRCSIVVVKKNNEVEILSEHCTPIKTNKIFH